MAYGKVAYMKGEDLLEATLSHKEPDQGTRNTPMGTFSMS